MTYLSVSECLCLPAPLNFCACISSPPDPMNNLKIFKDHALEKLVPNYYKRFPADHLDELEMNSIVE